jgi:hypothetical protein
MREPLALVEVDVTGVGAPTNDGSRGSGLYRVPIKLNRKPDHIEAALLVKVWDSPPSFTTMHRPGTLSVTGDTVVLERTTIEEVADVHAQTLRLVVDETNRLAAHERARREAAEAMAAADKARHEEHVSHIAKDITF